jgi:hypothetical protein
VWAVVALAAMLICASLHGQTTASLIGTVTASGGPLAGVRVTISSPALQGTRSAMTGEAGAYIFAALPPGDYRVDFEHPRFRAARRETTLRLSQVSRVDMALAAGETITVQADTPSVLETPEVSTSLTLRQIERLPIQRNQLATAQLAPGVTANTLSNGQLQISGGPGYDNLVLVNGVVVTENTRGQMRPMYVEDAIQETTLLTGAISAEYGRFSGGVVSTVTKSGGNELSASLRDSLSSPRWSARSPALETRESTINHVWEATFGGYVLRDRLWFFSAGRWAKNDTARQTTPVPAFAGTPATAAGPAISYAERNDQKRWEGKLTGLLGAQQTLTASYFGIRTDGTNVRFNNNFYDLASLTTRDDPESLLALYYDGVVRPNVFLEGRWSERRFSDRSGAVTTDLVGGTLLLDRSNNNARFHAPSLCGICDAQRNNNRNAQLAAHAFLDAGRLGTHDLAAGVDRFVQDRFASNHQSGSDFLLFVTRVQTVNGAIYPVITPSNANGGGTFIRWTPVLVDAAPNHLRTDSAYLNDVWTPGRRWRLSLGVRFDRNHATDADGTLASDDHKLSPRLSVRYDLRGDGRQQLSASFADYTTLIADSIASSNQVAGNAAAIDFAYRGPAINDRTLNTSMDEVIRMVFDYFNNTQGGTANRNPINLRPNGSRAIPGYTAYFDGTLASPYVRELTLGYGARLGRNGYVRADLVHRDWHDFYVQSVTTATVHTNTPLGIPVDPALIRNSNHIERRYRGLQLQTRWTPGRFDAGVFYTWSTLRGNDEGETATNGAMPNVDRTIYYPEYFAYDRAAPIGYLSGDQRHRLRAWAGYERPLGPAMLALSLLHSFDSGLPYSMAAPINLTRYAGAPANPGYNAIPNGMYYFSGRGELRTDDIQSTDLALRTSVRAGRLEWFAQGDVLNVFNRAGIADPTRISTVVATAATSTTLQPFDPVKQTPVAGVHYQPAANFGQPLNNLAYQTPRTWRISLGARF